MEHREKRPRLGDVEAPIFNSAAYAPSATPPSAIAESSATIAAAAPEPVPETAQDVSTPLTSEPVTMPDKSTWQGWAEIENDPVGPPNQGLDYSVGPFPNLI